MSSFFRWWAELRNPTLKCVRLGHALETRKLFIMRQAAERWLIVTEHEAEFTRCRRCCYRSGPDNETYSKGFHSCQLPNETWRTMDTQGYVVSGPQASWKELI